MISASKSTLNLNNLKILRPKVTNNLTNLCKKFCESPPRHSNCSSGGKYCCIHSGPEIMTFEGIFVRQRCLFRFVYHKCSIRKFVVTINRFDLKPKFDTPLTLNTLTLLNLCETWQKQKKKQIFFHLLLDCAKQSLKTRQTPCDPFSPAWNKT